MVSARPLLPCVVVALSLSACQGEPRSASWTFEFQSSALAARSAVIEARILEGGCDGTEVYSTLLVDGVAAPRPDVVGPGLVGLAGRARDASCVWFAEGCTPVMLPQPEGSEIAVVLAATDEVPACAGECIAGTCPEPDAGLMDAGLSDGGPADAVVPIDVGPAPDGGCDPADYPACASGVLTSCLPDGALSGMMCALGCNVTGDGCAPPTDVLIPSNVGALRLTSGHADLRAGGIPPAAVVLDTADGSIDGYAAPDRGEAATVIRAAGPGNVAGVGFDVVTSGGVELGVFSIEDLHIDAGSFVVGVGARPLVLLANGVVDVSGTIVVGADFVLGERTPGPGGRAGGAPTMNGQGAGGGGAGPDPAGAEEDGGGGASFGGAGGRGGTNAGVGGAPGSTHGNATLVPLFGGSGGGGAPESATGGRGGNGGGALQISAGVAISIAATGGIDACGGGGGPGIVVGGTGGGGGGAGSGGAVLLEAPSVSVAGRVGANGGSGGQGTVTPTESGQAGRRGLIDMASVAGSASSSAGGGGGRGSDAAGVAGAGGTATNGGGGGGGGGRIRINNGDGTGLSTYAPRVLPSSASTFTVGTITLGT